jgi:predicted MPP superfamily phosphohydrolase
MNKSLTRIIIILALYLYTLFKVYQLFPGRIMLDEAITFLLFLTIALGLRNVKWKAFGWITNMVMSLVSVFIFLSIIPDIILLIYSFISIHSVKGLAYQIELLVLAASLFFTFLGYLEALRGPKVREVLCPIVDLPDAFHNFRIVQLSDLHVGPTIKKKYITNVVSIANSLSPDVIFVTGDIADATPSKVVVDIEPLSNLQCLHGVYYVTGNHEYYWGAAAWVDAVKALGMIPLINSNQIINISDSTLMIAGITDNIGGSFMPDHAPDLPKALHSLEKTDIKILLAHRPDPYEAAENLGVSLQFSGHTHGGQYFPFNMLVSFFHKYYRHLNRYNNMWLYVNKGTGYWGPMNRFGVRAEITLCVLSKEVMP